MGSIIPVSSQPLMKFLWHLLSGCQMYDWDILESLVRYIQKNMMAGAFPAKWQSNKNVFKIPEAFVGDYILQHNITVVFR